MKTALFVSSLLLLVAGVASAHSYPARRSIAVQAERDAVVIFAVWTAPSGEIGELFEVGAAFAGRAKARAALEARLAAKALGPVTLTLDGEPLEPDSVRTRLIEDPPRSGRRGIAVLLEAKIPPGEHALAVGLGASGDATRMNFVDRSQGAAQACGRVPEGGLAPAGTTFTLTWKDRT